MTSARDHAYTKQDFANEFDDSSFIENQPDLVEHQETIVYQSSGANSEIPVPSLALKTDTFIDCLITCADDKVEGGNIWISPRLYIPAYSRLNDQMNAFYRALADDEMPAKPKIGTIVVAKFDADGCFYRARFMKRVSADRAVVRFIDFGNQSEVQLPSVKLMIKKFSLEQLPPLGIRCIDPALCAGLDKYEAEVMGITGSQEQQKYLTARILKVLCDRDTGEPIPMICIYEIDQEKYANTGGYINLSKNLLVKMKKAKLGGKE